MAKGQRLHEKRRKSPHEPTLPQFDCPTIAEEVAQEVVDVDYGEEIRRLEHFKFQG